MPAGQAATPSAQTRGAPTTPGAPHPIGPSASVSVRSARTCVGLLARLRTHFLAVTGSAMRPAPKAHCQPQTAAAVRRPDPVCPRLCDLLQARTAARAHGRALNPVSGKASASRSPRRTLNRSRRPSRVDLSSPKPTRQSWSPRPKHMHTHIRPHAPTDTQTRARAHARMFTQTRSQFARSGPNPGSVSGVCVCVCVPVRLSVSVCACVIYTP